jgi:hypothetical protein
MDKKERGPGEMGRREWHFDESTGECVEMLFCEGMNEPLELQRRPAGDTEPSNLPQPQGRLAPYLRGICFMCDACNANLATHVVGKRATICRECLERDPDLEWKMEADRRERQQAILKKYGYVGE